MSMKLTVPFAWSTVLSLGELAAADAAAGSEAVLSAAAQIESHDDRPSATAIAADRRATEERPLD
ncbi:hypothetical protein [Paraburkholderia sp.]|uniref:hypothetical protein n=1 Tax=Paraburkholderia sp. TaxID=1926495 RepID=UPI002636B9F3|nr:hypothetical protein [Paraburkholderia sp.]